MPYDDLHYTHSHLLDMLHFEIRLRIGLSSYFSQISLSKYSNARTNFHIAFSHAESTEVSPGNF
jgi:hypothetical protein